MKTKTFLLFIAVLLFSCNTGSKTNQNSLQAKVLKLKNASGVGITLIVTSKTKTYTVVLPQDSAMEVLGLSEYNNSFEKLLKAKIDYLAYRKADSTTIVLIDRKNNLCLSDVDIIVKSKGDLTVKTSNNKTTPEKMVLYYPLE